MKRRAEVVGILGQTGVICAVLLEERRVGDQNRYMQVEPMAELPPLTIEGEIASNDPSAPH